MSVSIATIPLYKNAKLSASAIKADLAKNWPDLPVLESTESEKGILVFQVGENSVFIAFMPAPIPWGDLEGPCATSILWKNAESDLKRHTAHLIVTLASEDSPVEKSTLLTQFCASILATCSESPGIYWFNATLVIPSEMFQEFATTVMPEGPPLFIWVDCRVGPSGKGKSSGFTTGMAALGHMEFETESASDAPGELRERFYALANYVLENGPVIKNGDTIGEDANERIQVVYAKSAFGHKGKVMRLEYNPTVKRKSWFGW